MSKSQSPTELDPVQITQELQERLEDLQKVDEEMKTAQRKVQELSRDREGKLTRINELRSQLDQSLNSQLEKAGVPRTAPGVYQR